MSNLEALTAARLEARSVDSFYIFGDSLSAIGNLAQANGRIYPADPPYFQGRYSNGLVWVEYLAFRLGIPPERITNYARGGATASRNSITPNLLVQFQSFLHSHSQVNLNALYIFWIGANDYFQGETNPHLPVEVILQTIAELANLGIQHVLIANLPDLGQFPATRNNTNAETLSTLATLHNFTLRRGLEQLALEFPSTRLVLLDAYKLYQKVMADPLRFGFANISQGYLSQRYNHQSPDQFLFWDDIHITTTAHQIVAEIAANTLTPVTQDTNWRYLGEEHHNLSISRFCSRLKEDMS